MPNALISNGVVVQIEPIPFDVASPLQWVNCPNSIRVGDRYNGSQFTGGNINDVTQAALLIALKAECKKRITAAYGETSFDEEIALRLRNGQSGAQDTERDRLRAKYQTLKTAIQALDQAGRNAYDVSVDSHWSAS